MTHRIEDRTGTDDLQRVSGEVANRLESLGIVLSGSESSEDLARILESVELFELAVKTRGGDLMVVEGPGGQTMDPDDMQFALPLRRADDTVERYLERLASARETVVLHPPLM